MVAEANRYFAGQEPWKLRKSDPARMNAVLYTTLETLREVGLLVQPFVPEAAARLLDSSPCRPSPQFRGSGGGRSPEGRHALARPKPGLPPLRATEVTS